MGNAALIAAALGCFAMPATARPLHVFIRRVFAQPPSTADCKLLFGTACYRPSQLQRVYDMSPLYEAGLSGTGQTIVLVEAFGSPTIGRDLRRFDRAFRLADPPSPQIVRAENFVIDHDLGDVISQSFGATEQTFPSRGSLRALRGAFMNAATHQVTVVAASGDQGASSLRTDLRSYGHRDTSWPASDPLVTAVGGTHLHLNAHGLRTAPDSVWNQTSPFGVPGASGGGRSAVFSRPSYQDSVAGVVGDHRGMPDLSMSADPTLVYTSFKGDPPGFQPIGGTSLSTPLFAGIVAIADQAAGHRLGLLNPALYALGFDNSGIIDITHGNNTFRFQSKGRNAVVRGFRATPGYVLSSGLGTVDGARLVTALARSL